MTEIRPGDQIAFGEGNGKQGAYERPVEHSAEQELGHGLTKSAAGSRGKVVHVLGAQELPLGPSAGTGISAMAQHLSDDKTLLLVGVNSDQCVIGSPVKTNALGYDCILVENAARGGQPTVSRWSYLTRRDLGS
ncbi:hypothetical protein K437DRAFT_274763 [Tilletiaria anomala UBC 951]|uniref:Uncharacterized protein n=1 Tax=Tilletiaria anomala (strain ATCC 24038 / CBS 436.72 / UBC 951) TaxID=1037660 RepID=A0A066VUH0_TILAU|nr:uncharacterized protein K437DRAFT_274763 [Tilletiaria anomala UBC 951]KDN43908.1 hypothetical protein K437DRAFT_274763 [Tilletiaria anomala UBC 951]